MAGADFSPPGAGIGGVAVPNVSGMSVKQMRDAMISTTSSIEETEQALRRARTATTKQENLAQQEDAAFAASLDRIRAGVEQSANRANVGVAKVRRASEELKMALGRCESLEQLTSFGIYERWRRKLDAQLCAGGNIERHNDVTPYLTLRNGYAAQEVVDDARTAEKQAQARHNTMKDELYASQSNAATLRKQLFAAVSERAELRREVAAQQRGVNEWWERHKAKLPEFREHLEWSRQAEASIRTLHQECEDSRQQLQALGAEEVTVQEDLQRAHTAFAKQEQQVTLFMGLAESYASTAHELGPTVLPTAAEQERIAEVRRASRRLEKTERMRDQFAEENTAAKESEAQAALERQQCESRIRRAQDELQDAERHTEILKQKRASTLRVLAERDDERRQMLQVHTRLALDLERDKCALATLGHVFERGRQDRKTPDNKLSGSELRSDAGGRSFSPRSRHRQHVLNLGPTRESLSCGPTANLRAGPL